VSAQLSLSDLKPAPALATASRILSRSLVERARRSSRVTTRTSPGSSLRIAFASSGRSVLAPETFSLNTLAAPAANSSASAPPALDVADDGLPARMDVHVLHGHLLLAFAAVAIERIKQHCISAGEFPTRGRASKWPSPALAAMPALRCDGFAYWIFPMKKAPGERRLVNCCGLARSLAEGL
jgi:hypothetical protein